MCFSIRQSVAALTATFITLLCAGAASADWNINKPGASKLRHDINVVIPTTDL